MPLVDMKDMLVHAYRHRYAVGGFDLVSLDFLEAILAAAEAQRAPAILSLAESHFKYYDFKLVMAAVELAAKQCSVPIAIHLDHGASLESAVTAINAGCNGVMVDASHATFTDNVTMTKAVVTMAHACGVPVEGELGYVAGVEGEDAENHPGEVIYTSVEEARAYVDQTRIDFLAVSIGTVHGRMQGHPRLEFERLEKINAVLNIPLVIHGGTGLSDDQYTRLIANGVAKINYYTALADAAAERMHHNIGKDGRGSYTAITNGIREAMTAEVERCMKVWGSAGQADAVLKSCKPWKPVEHLIIYNVKDINEEQALSMIAEGEKVLSAIPGVREVVTGRAVNEEAKYRYTWLVRFCHPAVIDSYREHPAHLAFADNLFRPVAGDRISIDYLQI